MAFSRRTRTDSGFTMMELMISVAIVGLLASVAIPNFVSYQARARTSEAFANLSGLGRAQKAYQAENDAFIDSENGATVTLPDYPSYGGLGSTKMPWDANAAALFDQVGWAPEGQVHYTYESHTGASVSAGCPCTLCFTLAAHGDVDDDTMISSIVYVHPEIDAVTGTATACPTYLGGLTAPIRPGSGDPIYDEPAKNASNDDF